MLVHGEYQAFARHTRLALLRLRTHCSSRPFTHLRTGFPFVCFPRLPDSVEVYLNGSANDSQELKLLSAWLEPGDSMIDAGANLGLYSIAAAHAVGRTARVVAVEPSPDLARSIIDSVRLLGLESVIVAQVCIGESHGETEYFVAHANQPTGEQSRRIAPEAVARYARTSVKMLTLDCLAAEHFGRTSPAFIKIDIEGAERLALAGAADLLASQDPSLWLVEINPAALRRFDAQAEDIVAAFPPATFECWLIPHHSRAGVSPAPHPLAPVERFEDAVYFNLVVLPLKGRYAARSPRLRALLRTD
jgi:FkbM family methyltransferase